MFRTKKDVERHVTDVLSKIDNENEKNLRGYTFARLYFQVKDYESAKKYLTGFLSVRDHHAASHKLMAQIYDATNNPECALQSYKRSLEIDPRQNDIVLKICELYCQLPVDHETARYWADRAEQLYPHHETIFKLREYLVSAEGEPDRQELENLIASELAAQPKNIDLRIKLLRLYLDTERVKDAYDHATLIESKRLFPQSVDWYYLLGDIFEAYQEEYNDVDSQFYIRYLTALDHLIFLTLAEPHTFHVNGRKSSSLNDAAAVLLTFDQLLKKTVEKDIKGGSWSYFTHHMKGQLYFHMSSLFMKRAKMEQGNRKEAFRFSAGLAVVCYTFKPINLLQEVWFSQMEDNQKAFTNFFQQGSLRTSFIGHVLLSLCKEDKSSWLQKIKTEVCIPQVKERIYNRIFTSLYQKEKLSSSFFITDPTFEQCSLELPTEVVLKENDKSAYKLCADSLHHLVWLELHGENVYNLICDNITEIFQNLQYSNKNLSKGSCESLCVLDLESYLYATVFQSKFIIERRSNVLARNDTLLSYPPDIADALCTKVQATWWKSAHDLYTCAIKEKHGEHRRTLQQGLEVIRGIGNHGMEVQLVIHLAHTFSNKADTLDKNSETKTDKKKKSKLTSDHVTALYIRATHYWNIALGMLEKLASGQTLKIPKDPMFSGSGKPLSKNDIKDYQDEGQLFLAVRLMNSDKLNDAAELLSKLASPYGSYYLALTLKKLASQEERYSSARTGLLVKVQNALHDTMDRIKDDKSHPLNKELFIELEDVENDLGLEHANENKNEGADETDTYDGSSIHNASYSWQENYTSAVHSTPRPSAKFITSTNRSVTNQESPTQHFEPSPERLDAQIRALALNQDSLVKAFLLQQETNKSIVESLKQIKDVVGEFKKQFEELSLTVGKHHRTKTVPKRHGYIKGQGDEEEDYYDPNGMLEYYEDGGEDFRASGYSFDPSTRMVHEAPPGASAPLNYVVSPALPPGPPPALNHFNYQYPPHAVLPTPPAVAERPPYYHPPPGQGLPFSEGQQLPQFHFHVASSIVKPPTVPTLTTSLAPMVPGLPSVSVPPPVSIPPPPPVVMPPAAPPIPAPTSWSKSVSVPHAFQIPLPSSTIFATASGIASTPIAPPVSVTATSSHSQLKDLLQTPVSKSVSFGQPLTATSPAALNTSPSLFSGLTQIPKECSRCDSENAASPDIDGHDLEREVMGDFKPLIPLPAEIVVETGEENEEVLFEDRAKLYRFVDQEWKERGIGVVKILYHEGSRRVRLLMRRDQVLKVCANHYITSNMEIHPLKNSDKAWTWVAPDFADEELRPEHFCIRFKTPEIAAAFKTAFEKAINISKNAEVRQVTSPKTSTAIATSPLSQKPFGGRFLPKTGSWSCPTCYVSNAADKLLCIACETKKPGSQTSTTTSVNSSVTSLSSENKSSFQSTAASSPFSFGFPIITCSTNSTASTMPSVNPSKNVFGGFTFSSSPVVQESETPELKEREILIVSTKSKDGPQVTKVSTPKTSPFIGFSFKPSSVITNVSSFESSTMSGTSPFTEFAFKSTAVTTSVSSTHPSIASGSSPLTDVSSCQPTTKTVTPANVSISHIQNSMQDISPAFVFAKTMEKNASSVNEVKASSSQSNMPESLFVNVSNEGRRVSTGAPESAPEEFVSTAEFKPVIPLPALVDVITGEENEEKLFGERAKLFRFNSETKEWKERGTGEIKILFLKESHRYRILMRREQVLKLCANHYILPEMKLTPLNNSDRAWIWIAQDYSDGEMTQVKLAVKFKNSDIAQQFLRVFEKCQNELLEYNNNNPPNSCAGNKNAFDKLLQPAANSWNCSKCSKSNMNRSSCIYCQTIHNEAAVSVNDISSSDQKIPDSSKPVKNATDKKDMSKTVPAEKTDKPLSEMFKPQAGSWECSTCLVRNNVDANKCASCETPKPGATSTASQPAFGKCQLFPPVKTDKPLSEMFKPQAGSWECDTCLVRNNVDANKCASCETPKPGTASTASQPAFGKFQLDSFTNSTPSFGFGNLKSNDFVFGIKPTTQSTTFSFGLTDVSNKSSEVTGFKPTFSTTDEPAIFGGTTQKTETPFSAFGTSALKNDSILVGASKPDSSVSVSSIFGGTSKKTDSSVNSSIFGGSQKSTQASIFGAPAQNSDIPKSIFGTLPEKSEGRTNLDTPQSTSVPVSNTQSVFSFGSASQKSDSTSFEFRFGSPLKYEFNFSGVRPRSPTKTPKSPRSPATPSDVEDEEENESFDADNIYFQPVIPLPPKIDVKTGEENETTLFCKRAKLFRFCSGEWKERGLGDIKILHDEVGKKIRLLMRREQVLKVCLNHYLTKDIVFEKRNDKTMSWAATDFSENEPSDEIFALKFKTSEFADEFKAAVESALNLISKQASTVDVSKAASKFSFRTDAGAKTEPSFTTGPLSAVFGTSNSLFVNAAPNTESAPSPFSFSFKDKPASGTFFSSQNTSDNKGFTSDKASRMKDTSDDDEIQIVYETVPSPEEVQLAKQLQLPPTFFLYKNKPPCPGCIGCEDFLPPAKLVTEPENSQQTETSNVSSNSSVSQEAEITLFKTAKDVIGFGELAKKSEFEGFSPTQKKGFEGAGTPLFANLNNSTEGDRDEDSVAQGPDIHFEPVIPLPELVEVKTGEEDETPIFVHRAKLFKYDGVKKEWKERGVGDLKILKHKEKLRYRIILRRDQVHKIACNHCIEPSMILSPLATSDSALCWNALDYSEVQAEASQFAVRFKNKELLQEFRNKFNECKDLLKQAVNENPVQAVQSSPAENYSHKESPAKNTTDYSDSTESSAESQNEHDHSGSESNEDEQDSDEDAVLFEKRCSFEISEGNEDNFKKFGPGTLKVMYDYNVFGYHVYMMTDSGQCLCDHIIAINNCLMVENKKVAAWTAVDISVDPPRRRRFRATFSSVEALKEFNGCFQEGKDAAVQSEIVEKIDCIFSPSGQQT